MASISSGKMNLSNKQSQMLKTTSNNNKQNNLQIRASSLMLKDYLMRDDLSSCSSNGFKSFPRRQCCSTVGLDLKSQRKKRSRRKRTNTIPRSVSSSFCSSSKASVLQRASTAFITAIKSLPGGKSKKSTASSGGGVLSRRFSKKLLSRSFWRKAAKEEEEGGDGTQKWRTSFRELLMLERGDNTASSMDEENVFAAAASGSATFSSSSSSSSSSGFDASSKSWGESEFTFSSSAASSSEGSAANDVVAQVAKDAAPNHQKEQVTMDWANEEKEQFSPVSVLDCPFEEEEEDDDNLNSTANSLLEGSEPKKHTQKRRHFQSVATLEPVTLDKRMTLLEAEDEPRNVEENARDLLHLVIKRKIPSNCFIVKVENLLFDYFKQSIVENNRIGENGLKKKGQLCEVAEDWMRGEQREVYLGWEVKEGRELYVREMDKYGEWRNSIDQEVVQQLAMEMENEVFTSLVNDFLLDLIMC